MEAYEACFLANLAVFPSACDFKAKTAPCPSLNLSYSMMKLHPGPSTTIGLNSLYRVQFKVNVCHTQYCDCIETLLDRLVLGVMMMSVHYLLMFRNKLGEQGQCNSFDSPEVRCQKLPEPCPFSQVRKLFRLTNVSVLRVQFVVAISFHPRKHFLNHRVSEIVDILVDDTNITLCQDTILHRLQLGE